MLRGMFGKIGQSALTRVGVWFPVSAIRVENYTCKQQRNRTQNPKKKKNWQKKGSIKSALMKLQVAGCIGRATTPVEVPVGMALCMPPQASWRGYLVGSGMQTGTRVRCVRRNLRKPMSDSTDWSLASLSVVSPVGKDVRNAAVAGKLPERRKKLSEVCRQSEWQTSDVHIHRKEKKMSPGTVGSPGRHGCRGPSVRL